MREDVQYEFDPVRDADLVVNAKQRFFDGVFFDTEVLRDLAITDPFYDQADDLVFSWCQQTLSLGIDYPPRRRRFQGFDQVAYLLSIRPKLALVDDRDAPAESSEWLGSTTEQSASSCSQGVYDETAIIAVQEENETNLRVAGVQATQHIDHMGVIGGTVADKYRVDLDLSQSLQAVGKLAATASNTEARLAAKRTAEKLCLRLVGIDQKDADGGVAGVRTGFHGYPPSRIIGGEDLMFFRGRGPDVLLGVSA